MAKLDNGLLYLKTKLFVPLSLAPQGVPLGLLTRSPGLPHRTTRASRKDLEVGNQKPHRTPNHPPRHQQYDFDEDDEKENTPTDPENNSSNWEPTLRHLLKKWEEDLNHLQSTVCQDLDDYKRKLGILQS
uniref:E4 protein n=1 Tax=Human papillomavirus TaxID=10566 RepID=A0A385PR26_9PAPI|nr:MAG: E4 protein [Human papillomavirus]